MTDLSIEVLVVPVADVDRAKDFFKGIGFREDVDYVGTGSFRVVHVTPPGSATSIVFGEGVTDAQPGTSQGIHFVVDDVVAARADLVAAGVDASEVFHDAGGVFHHAGSTDRVTGPQRDRRSYGSFLSFQDPDGNGYLVQEVTTRQPGRIDRAVYRSANDLEQALRAAAVAHGQHEKEIGHADPEWPAWYATHMARAAGLLS